MSTIKVDSIQTTGGVDQYTSKAWVNFNGTGTVAIRADGNVSSLTDNGAGRYQVNFSSNTPDASYSAQGNMRATGGGGNAQVACLVEYNGFSTLAVAMQTSSVRFCCITNTFNTNDSEYVGVNIVR